MTYLRRSSHIPGSLRTIARPPRLPFQLPLGRDLRGSDIPLSPGSKLSITCSLSEKRPRPPQSSASMVPSSGRKRHPAVMAAANYFEREVFDCSEFALLVIPIFDASRCPKIGKATHSARTTPWRATASGASHANSRDRTCSGQNHDPEHGTTAPVHPRSGCA